MIIARSNHVIDWLAPAYLPAWANKLTEQRNNWLAGW